MYERLWKVSRLLESSGEGYATVHQSVSEVHGVSKLMVFVWVTPAFLPLGTACHENWVPTDEVAHRIEANREPVYEPTLLLFVVF